MIKFTKLAVDYEIKPIGITQPPDFEWTVESDAEYSQKYFRIRVFSDSALQDKPDILDTGNVYDDAVNCHCKDISLKPFSKYFWSVEVCNGANGEIAISEVNEFVTSVLSRSQWTADIFTKLEGINIFLERKIFNINKPVKDAYIFIASTGAKSNGYHVFLNGERVGDDVIMPGPLEYMTMLVKGYDVTDMLKEKNIINIDHVTGLSVILKIFFKDGSGEIIKTDGSWQSYIGEHQYFSGYEPRGHRGKFERYDAGKRNDDWYRADGGCTELAPIKNIGWGPVKLRYSGLGAKICEELKPTTVYKSAERIIFDFGKIQSGFAEVVLRNQKNKITVRYAEMIEDNRLCTSQYGNQYLPVTEYIPKNDEIEIFRPYFMHTSYRYIEITGMDGSIAEEDVRGFFIHDDIEGKSSFESSDTELNYVYKCIQRSYMSNLIHIPTDCPGRERRGWTADSYAVIDSQCFMYNVYRLYDKWMRDLHDNQRMNGWCTVELPDRTDPCVDLNWPMHIIIVPWTVYKHYGNKCILEKNIDSMEKYCELLYELSDEYMFCDNLFSYGDWVASDRASGAYIGAAMFYYVTKLLSCAEKELNNTSLYEKYLYRCERIKEAINKKYLHTTGNKAYYDNNSQSANCLALMFDLCPTDKKNAVFEELANDIEEKNALTLGFIANTWIYLVLSRFGRNDLAYRLISDKSVEGSMSAMVSRLKNETLNESFTRTKDSLNHSFLGGGAASWLYRCLMGVAILKPGYKEYEIKPYFPESMQSLAVSTKTPYGLIKLEWVNNNGEIDVKITAPAAAEGAFVFKNEKIKLRSGINNIRIVNGRICG